MFRRLFYPCAPATPQPAGIVCLPKDTYTGLQAIEDHGANSQNSIYVSGRVRCVAIRQQDQFYEALQRLLGDQMKDHRELDAEYNMKMQNAVAQHADNLRSLNLKPNQNGSVLRAKRVEKKFIRRLRSLQKEKARQIACLDIWYECQPGRYVQKFRKEWNQTDYCDGYPFWADGDHSTVVL
ncbi:hypothetical protein EsH8_I_001356 [Colletotrichum jinshuiense]